MFKGKFYAIPLPHQESCLQDRPNVPGNKSDFLKKKCHSSLYSNYTVNFWPIRIRQKNVFIYCIFTVRYNTEVRKLGSGKPLLESSFKLFSILFGP